MDSSEQGPTQDAPELPESNEEVSKNFEAAERIDWRPLESSSAQKVGLELANLDSDEEDVEMIGKVHLDYRGDLSSSSGTTDSSDDTSDESEDEEEVMEVVEVKEEVEEEEYVVEVKKEVEEEEDDVVWVKKEVEEEMTNNVAENGVMVKEEPVNVFVQRNTKCLVTYDSSTSSDSSSESSDDEEERLEREKLLRERQKERELEGAKTINFVPLRVQGEVTVEDLPPIEELSLTVGEDIKLEQVGFVSSLVESLVVIQCLPGAPCLDDDSLLFREDRTSIGKVFELFGPVMAPCCTVRFNSAEHARESGMEPNMPVFFAPQHPQFSRVVMPARLHQKGSDASWKNDDEPPPQFLEYSDDETERREKRKRKGRADEETASTSSEPTAGFTPNPRTAPWRKEWASQPPPSCRPPAPCGPHIRSPAGAWPPRMENPWSHPPPGPCNRPPGPWGGPSSSGAPSGPPAPAAATSISMPPTDLSVPPPGWSSVPAVPSNAAPSDKDPEFKRYFEYYYNYYQDYYKAQAPPK